MADAYDPRAAALAHGYAAACAANMKRSSPRVVWEDEAIQAVAAGLVYVGDQIGRLVPIVDAEVVSEREQRLEAALTAIVEHEEHFGSGPPDDEMRAIATAALAAGER